MAFQINTTTLTYITAADWPDDTISQSLAGASQFARYQRHTWRAGVMPASEYDTLSALEGQKVSITTTNYTSRNTFKQYFGADFDRLSGRHEGPLMLDVVAEFTVRV